MQPPASSPLPPKVLARLSPAGARLARAWWATLGEAERAELRAAWSPRANARAHAATRGRGGGGRRRPALRIEARPEGEAVDEPTFPIDYYEYLVNHEITLEDRPPFHICTRHESGRRAAREGRIAAGFTCPLGRGSCPLQGASERFGGKAVRFVVRREA